MQINPEKEKRGYENSGEANAIDGYIMEQSEEAKPILNNICETIRTAAPCAIEKISWGMPTF